MAAPTVDALDPRATLAVLAQGRGDPTTVVDRSELWWATRTPAGPGTLHVSWWGGALEAEAWGAGADWLRERVPDLLGVDDEPDELVPHHAIVAEVKHRHAGLRIGRTGVVLHALVPAILAQRVTGLEARRAWNGLCWRLGEPAPGPRRLVLPPAPEALAGQPYWWYHRLGVDRRRADTVRRVGALARPLEAAATLPLTDAYRRLASVPGVGPWTVATVGGVAFGDADAVVVGDYHLPHLVSYALAGERRATDERMVELLEPYRGQRGRVVRLLAASGLGPPRRAPRQAIQPMASW